MEFTMAGPPAVAVGTANFYEPQTALQVIASIREFMQRRGLQDVREIVGSVEAGNQCRHPAENLRLRARIRALPSFCGRR
jgi:hypothetical protein